MEQAITKAEVKTHFGSQDIILGLSDPDYIFEKVEIPVLTKKKVKVFVRPGTVLFIDGYEFVGQIEPFEFPYKFKNSPQTPPVMIGNSISTSTVILYPADKLQGRQISFRFWAGQHELYVDDDLDEKGKFSVAGEANLKINDFKALIKAFSCSMKKDELVDYLISTVRDTLSSETTSAVSRHLTPETTQKELSSKLNKEVTDEMWDSEKTNTVLRKYGLKLLPSGITLHLNDMRQ